MSLPLSLPMLLPVSFLVVSGLPGSGKSSLARALAPRLGLVVLDKDDVLESLFEERGIGDRAWRRALSREADTRFAAAALALERACLVSWWQHPAQPPQAGGTPTAWLANLRQPLVQIHCRCRPETAVERFLARQRHPGHLDATRSREQLLAEFAALAALGPLPIEPIIEVDTEVDTRQPIDLATIERAIRR